MEGLHGLVMQFSGMEKMVCYGGASWTGIYRGHTFKKIMEPPPLSPELCS